jgi:hypothetical protein
VHGTPACVTVNVRPAIVSDPVRDAVAVFAPTAYAIVPLLDPLVAPLIVSHGLEEEAVHAQPAGIVIATLPCVAGDDTSALIGEIDDVHGTPACVTLNVCPPMVSDPLRLAALMLAATAYVTVPAPDPVPPEETVSHGTELPAVHEHPGAELTPTVPLVASGATVAFVGEIANVQATPACVTENTCPAIVSDPLREDVDVLVATLYVTCPFALPVAPDVTVIHGTPLDAVQAHPVALVTATDPAAAAASTDAFTGEIA